MPVGAVTLPVMITSVFRDAYTVTLAVRHTNDDTVTISSTSDITRAIATRLESLPRLEFTADSLTPIGGASFATLRSDAVLQVHIRRAFLG